MTTNAPFRPLLPKAMAVVLVAGCGSLVNYGGDGRLTDNGPFAAKDRYVIDLGAVDLTQRNSRMYRLRDLPKANFVVGLEISGVRSPSGPGTGLVDDRLANVTVGVRLSSDQTTLFTKQGELRKWTWSIGDEPKAFLYGSGQPGTYFDASTDVGYSLSFEVSEPLRTGSEGISARLVAKSGGWK